MIKKYTRKKIQYGGKIGWIKRAKIKTPHGFKTIASAAVKTIAAPITLAKAGVASAVTGVKSIVYKAPMGVIKSIYYAPKTLYRMKKVKQSKNQLKQAEKSGNPVKIQEAEHHVAVRKAKYEETRGKLGHAVMNTVGVHTVIDMAKRGQASIQKSHRDLAKRGLLFGNTRLQALKTKIKSQSEILGIGANISKIKSSIFKRKFGTESGIAKAHTTNLVNLYENKYGHEAMARHTAKAAELRGKSNKTAAQHLELHKIDKELKIGETMRAKIIARLKEKQLSKKHKENAEHNDNKAPLLEHEEHEYHNNNATSKGWQQHKNSEKDVHNYSNLAAYNKRDKLLKPLMRDKIIREHNAKEAQLKEALKHMSKDKHNAMEHAIHNVLAQHHTADIKKHYLEEDSNA